MAGDVQAHHSGCGHLPNWVVRGNLSKQHLVVSDPLLEGQKREYWYYVPSQYTGNSSVPLVMDFHGYYDEAESEADEDKVHVIAEQNNFIAVFPNAWNDSPGRQRWLGGWGQHGHEGQYGAHGKICHERHSKYVCYRSCEKKGMCSGPDRNSSDCHAGSCVDDDLFVHVLLDELLTTFCVDVNSIHATGISSGAVFLYGLATSSVGKKLLSRLASLVLVAGNPFLGFFNAPSTPLAIMDIHGSKDYCVPANASNVWGKFKNNCPVQGLEAQECTVGCDWWYYEPTQRVLQMWERANGCGEPVTHQHFPTDDAFDKFPGFWCATRASSRCKAPVVQCIHNGGHNWPFKIGKKGSDRLKYAKLMWWFMSRQKLGGSAQARKQSIYYAANPYHNGRLTPGDKANQSGRLWQWIYFILTIFTFAILPAALLFVKIWKPRQGNFDSVDGEPPTGTHLGARYTSVRTIGALEEGHHQYEPEVGTTDMRPQE